MKCPHCGSENIYLERGHNGELNKRYRQKRCRSCGYTGQKRYQLKFGEAKVAEIKGDF